MMKFFKIFAVLSILTSLAIIPAVNFAEDEDKGQVFLVKKTTPGSITLVTMKGKVLKVYMAPGIPQKKVNYLQGRNVRLTFDGKSHISIWQSLGFFRNPKIIVNRITDATSLELPSQK